MPHCPSMSSGSLAARHPFQLLHPTEQLTDVACGQANLCSYRMDADEGADRKTITNPPTHVDTADFSSDCLPFPLRLSVAWTDFSH